MPTVLLRFLSFRYVCCVLMFVYVTLQQCVCGSSVSSETLHTRNVNYLHAGLFSHLWMASLNTRGPIITLILHLQGKSSCLALDNWFCLFFIFVVLFWWCKFSFILYSVLISLCLFKGSQRTGAVC